jgi:hypothetical protein
MIIDDNRRSSKINITSLEMLVHSSVASEQFSGCSLPCIEGKTLS